MYKSDRKSVNKKNQLNPFDISSYLRYSLKAYNFYLYPENEMDAIEFRSRVIFIKENSNSLVFFRVHHYNFLLLIILILLNYSSKEYIFLLNLFISYRSIVFFSQEFLLFLKQPIYKN